MRLIRALLLGAAGASCAAAALLPTAALGAETASQPYSETGEHLFIVPPGVSSVRVALVGGAGVEGVGEAPLGGAGASVGGILAVTPGESLFAEVGGSYQVTNEGPGREAFNGGGAGGGFYGSSGGGASDIRTCSANPANPLDPLGCAMRNPFSTRLLVAGGGGGGGGNSNETGVLGGAGGNAGEPAQPGHYGDKSNTGDLGGDGGGAATPTQGGSPGVISNSKGAGATEGLLGIGGRGGGEISTFADAGGGGGGGGIYGGGGGGGGQSETGQLAGGGGGGGGSSGVPAGVGSVSFVSIATASHLTPPSVTLTWTLPAPTVITAAPTGVTTTTATLSGSVNPNDFQVSDCHFTISPAPSPGASAPCAQQVGGGGAPVPVSASITGLSPATTYTVTLVAASAQGSSSGAPVTFATPALFGKAEPGSPGALAVTGLSLSPSRFRRGRLPATIARAAAHRKAKKLPTFTNIAFALSQPAAVTLSFQAAKSGVIARGKCTAPTKGRRRGRPCTRYVGVPGAVSRAAHAGTNRIRFQGLLDGGRSLAPGRYRLSLGAANAGGRASAAQHPGFTLLP